MIYMGYLLFMPVLITFAAMVLDFVFGDPRLICHPVILIGKLISILESKLLPSFEKERNAGTGNTNKVKKTTAKEAKTGERWRVRERIAGTVFGILVCAVSTIIPFAVLYILYYRNIAGVSLRADDTKITVSAAAVALEIFFCFRLLAARSLETESMRVYEALRNGTIEDARRQLSMIVGRDTRQLDEDGIIRAAVETIAENTSDGVTAPLFYMMIAGAAGGFFYKSVNTMDSMVGYKNEKYLYFGSFAARLDDILNYLPSRISALCMILSAGICGYSVKNAWRIFRRDRYRHASPNSAQTESVMAGALQVRLAGPASYFGKVYEKPFIGDPVRKIEAKDIIAANRIMKVTAVISWIVLAAVRVIVITVIFGT